MRNYWQPGVTKDIGKHMDGCDLCQRIINRTEILAKKLIANEISEKLQIYLIVDFITSLPLVAGKDAILVVCDKLCHILSKITYFVAMTEETLVEELVRLF